jgi:hypothetical protein
VIFDCRVAKKENCFPMIPSGKAHNEMVARIHDSKRVFVSEVFSRIDPKRFLQLIEKPQELPAWMNLPKAA